MVYSPFKTKMVACYDQDSTSGGEGAGPQPAHAGSGLRFQDGDSLCNWRDRRWVREARSRFCPGSRGRGSDLERGLCPSHPGAPPLPRPPNRLPHSFSPKGCHLRPLLVSSLGGLCFRSPKPWGPSMLVPAPGPFRALSFSPAVEASVFLLDSPVLGAHTPSVPSNSCPSPPPSLSCTCFLPYHSNVLILFLEAISIEGLIAI